MGHVTVHVNRFPVESEAILWDVRGLDTVDRVHSSNVCHSNPDVTRHVIAVPPRRSAGSKRAESHRWDLLMELDVGMGKSCQFSSGDGWVMAGASVERSRNKTMRWRSQCPVSALRGAVLAVPLDLVASETNQIPKNYFIDCQPVTSSASNSSKFKFGAAWKFWIFFCKNKKKLNSI